MSQVASPLERLILDLINDSRTAAGLNPLTLELNLNQSANDHSEWMSDTLTFSHTGVNGTSSGDRIRSEVDIAGTWGTGENIAAHTGYTNENQNPAAQASLIHTAFMNSPGHRSNIMDPDFTHLGVGIVYGPMDFGSAIADAVIVTQNFAYSGGRLEDDILGGRPVDDTPDVPDVPDTSGEMLTASIGADLMEGTSGNDTIDGRAGDDTIDGGAGNDFIKGGKGNDVLEDTQGNNRLNGQKGDDHLIGGDGEDRLNGGGGQDTLEAGSGDDFLKGGTRNDVAYGGAGNDQMFGNRHDDTLYGGAGHDTLNGGGENDRLDGGAGNDTLKGGEGNDVFVFTSGKDVIEDYDASADSIALAAILAGRDASVTDLLDDHATVFNGGVILNFGSSGELEVRGDVTLAQLAEDIEFF